MAGFNHPPTWSLNVPNKIFPHNYLRLYWYLCGFGPHTCYRWNRKLAEKLGVSRGTIKRALRWLLDHNLISIEKPLLGNRRFNIVQAHKRRLIHAKYPDHLPNAPNFQPVKTRSRKATGFRLSPSDFEASRQRNLAALFAAACGSK